MMTDQICEQLYKDYYIQDKSPAAVQSSHWQTMHRQTRVDLSGNVFVGHGFGDLQYNKWHHVLLAWMTIRSYLLHLPNRRGILELIPQGRHVARRMRLTFSYDCFRQVCALALLKKHINNWDGLTVLNIGDGYGFLSALIKELFPQTEIVLVDLGKTLIFQAYHIQGAAPRARHVLVNQKAEARPDFLYCPAENLHLLRGRRFDLAINIASMQEMNEETIDRYFHFLRGHLKDGGLFYCCNRQEKIMSGGEVARFEDYPWSPKDEHLVDEVCHWYRYYLALRPTKHGPHWGPVRIPLVNYFDGATRHRLSRLAKSL